MSASFEGKSTDIARLREFRKMVNNRKEPSTVIFLRRLVVVVTALILGIVSINIGFKISFYKDFQAITETNSILNEITILLFESHSCFRTLINIDNGFQENQIQGEVA